MRVICLASLKVMKCKPQLFNNIDRIVLEENRMGGWLISEYGNQLTNMHLHDIWLQAISSAMM